MTKREREDKEPVLVVRFSALGDVAMTLPVLYDACMAEPDRHFIMLTRSHAASIFTHHPDNLTIVTPNLDSYSGIYGLWRLFRELDREYRFSTIVDLHDVLRSQVLRMFARVYGKQVVKIHKGRREKRMLTRSGNKVLIQLTPTIERYRSAFLRAGIPQPGRFRTIYETPADQSLFAKVTSPKREEEKWIGIAPFAAHEGKIYPLEHMEKVVAHFSAKSNVKIFVFGFGKQEKEQIAQWAERYPNVYNMAAHHIGIAAEMALLNYCNVMVSMDSANTHLAALAGCRVITIWGATHPYCGFMGWKQREEDAVQLDMTCRPCSVFGNKPCRRGDYYCLKGISPSMVIKKVESSL